MPTPPDNDTLHAAGYRLLRPGVDTLPELSRNYTPSPKHLIIALDGVMIGVSEAGLESNAYALARYHYRKTRIK